MSKTLSKIASRPWVAHIDDERAEGNSIIVTLHNDYVFVDERDCGVRGFDTIQEAEQGTRGTAVITLVEVNRERFVGKAVVHMGEVWKVIGVGVSTPNNTFCHLMSLDRGKQQKNGWVGHQINDWVDTAVLKAARQGA